MTDGIVYTRYAQVVIENTQGQSAPSNRAQSRQSSKIPTRRNIALGNRRRVPEFRNWVEDLADWVSYRVVGGEPCRHVQSAWWAEWEDSSALSQSARNQRTWALSVEFWKHPDRTKRTSAVAVRYTYINSLRPDLTRPNRKRKECRKSRKRKEKEGKGMKRKEKLEKPGKPRKLEKLESHSFPFCGSLVPPRNTQVASLLCRLFFGTEIVIVAGCCTRANQ